MIPFRPPFPPGLRLALGFLALEISGGTSLLARTPDAAEGKKVYATCIACHAVDKTNKLGPGLAGLMGRKVGTAEGFRYSRAMKKSVLIWDEKTLDAYLANPQGTLPGSVMPFPGLPDAGQRADLIAYLKTLQ